jgi:hypothetical protein
MGRFGCAYFFVIYGRKQDKKIMKSSPIQCNFNSKFNAILILISLCKHYFI